MESNIVSIASDLSLTHHFIYRGKQYPFNIVIFNLFSRFFISNQQLKPESGIKLLEDGEDDIEIPDSSIKDFVNYCQNQNINLSKENVFFVHKLAKKFIVPSLIKAAENFITINRKELVIEYLNLNSDQQKFDSVECEEMIAIDLPEYVKSDKLISLPFQVIYKITTRYKQKKLNSKSEHPSEIIDFLFKCLNHFGRRASILFDNFDFGNLNGTVINRLLTEYSEKFDFHFINHSYLKTVYKLENDLIEREEKMKIENEKMKVMLNQMEQKIESIIRENKNDEIKQILSNLSDKLNREIQIKNDEIKQINDKYNELKIEMDGMKSNYENQIGTMKDEFTRQMTNLSENVRQLTEKVAGQTVFIDQLKAKIEEEKRKSKPSVSCQFTNYSDPKGIISILDNQVSLSAGGDNHPSYPLANIKKYDDTRFLNYYNTSPSSEKDSYILFDFGNSKKIDLYSYLIRSYGNSPNCYYQPKTWRVEGSNDNLKWEPLDRRVNDPTLNASGSFIQHNFSCQQNNHLKENRYRYIRYVQEDSWVNGYPYRIYLTYFELYGNVYN